MLSVLVVDTAGGTVLHDGTSSVDRLLRQLGDLRSRGHIRIADPIIVDARDHAQLLGHLDTTEDVAVLDGRMVAHAPALRALLGDQRLHSALLAGTADQVLGGFAVTTDREGKVVTAVATPRHQALSSGQRGVGGIRLTSAASQLVMHRLQEWLERHGAPSTPGFDDAPVETIVAEALELGIRFRPVPLRGMEGHRPLHSIEAEEAQRRCTAVDEERAWLDAAVKAKDGWFTTFFVSPYSRFVARWAAHRGFTPNQVTVVSALVGFGAAAAFAMGTLPWAVVGAFALQVAFMLDCVDGQLSRYTQRFSDFGAWLDSMLDRAKELVVYLGLAVGASRADGSDAWLLAVAAAALLVLRHAVDLAHEAAQPNADLRPLSTLTSPNDAPEVEPSGPHDEGRVPGGNPPSLRQTLRGAAASPLATWLLRVLAFPIGERFAVISLLAVFASRRSVFLVLLIWGVVAWAANVALKLWRARRWAQRRLGWLAGALPRVIDHGTVVLLAAWEPRARIAGFALILTLGLRHYDEGYRTRTLGTDRASAGIAAILGAWYVRVPILLVGAAAGILVPVLWLVTGVVATLMTVDLVRAWIPSPTIARSSS